MEAVNSRAKRPAPGLRRRQPDATRRRILSAATCEFAAKGLAGARVDEIAARARVSKRMLYHYFGHKEALWLAVLERVYANMREGEQALKLGTLDPDQGMRLLIRFNFRYHAEHPEFLAMLNEENRQRARNLSRSARVPAMYSPLIRAIEDLLQRGAAGGVFRSDLDPVQLYISIAALSYFYCSNRYTLSTIFGRDLSSPQEMLQREDHVIEVIMGFLRP